MAQNFQERLTPFDVLEEARIEDARRKDAYETLPSRFRQALKTGIALAHLNTRPICTSTVQTTIHRHAGIKHTFRQSPLDWALILFAADYSAAARMSMAATMPRLFDIDTVFAVCLDGEPHEAILLSLEIAGCEDLSLLPSASLTHLETCLQTLEGDGIVLSFLSTIPDICKHCNASIQYLEPRKPNICLDMQASHLFDRDLLAFAHGTTLFQTELSKKTDLLFTSSEQAEKIVHEGTVPNLLILPPGCEGYWRFSGLAKEHFCKQTDLFSTTI